MEQSGGAKQRWTHAGGSGASNPRPSKIFFLVYIPLFRKFFDGKYSESHNFYYTVKAAVNGIHSISSQMNYECITAKQTFQVRRIYQYSILFETAVSYGFRSCNHSILSRNIKKKLVYFIAVPICCAFFKYYFCVSQISDFASVNEYLCVLKSSSVNRFWFLFSVEMVISRLHRRNRNL